MSSTATKPGATATKGGGAADGAAEGTKKGGKKKLLLIVAIVLVVAAGAAYWFLFRGSSSAAAKPKAAPKPELGAVLTVDPISINLADGHYLKLGFALQEIKAPKEAELDGSKALDTAITLYSGKTIAELSDPASRETLKKEFVKELTAGYEKDVVDVYFTSYVMQ
jgi:flagellar FliL protein